ncbi:MAG: efflux RND transporter permease subunit, partial [Gemmatimonadetes bacterium]|nr:efflux RND transporter permease subunit [Gemmatimonadota bacterium]
ARLPLAFLPQVEFPFIGVVVPYSGGIPTEVERDIARPIEEILATLGGVREIFSESDEDQAFIGVDFDWGRDVNVLRMEVQEKIDQARPDLPSDVRDIFLFTFNSNDIPVIEGRISAKGRDLSENWDLIDQKIVRPLQQIPGVGQVGIDGVNPTIGAVYLRIDKIREFNVDVERLFQELAAANVDLAVGRVTDQGLRYDVRTVSGIHSMDELGELPIDDRGLRLADVAELVYAAPAPSYGRHLNGEFAIAFWIQKASGFNTVEVCREVERTLEEINLDPALRGIDCFTFFNQADQITNSLEGLWKAGLFGSALSMVVLYVFLRRVGLTLLVSLSIPISILVTGIWLYLSGGNLNVLSMMGLMLGIGMLVDNAVVVLESIHRRRHLGASPVAAALRGTKDVGRAIVASTLTTVIVFAPIVVTKKNELAVWLGTVGATISVTIVASLLVSLTVIPAMSVWMARGGRPEAAEPPGLERLRRHYESLLRWTTIRRPRLTGFLLVPLTLALTVGLIVITGFKPDVESDEGVKHERLRIAFRYTGAVDKRTSQSYVETVEDYLETRREDLGLRDVYAFWGADYAGFSLFFREGDLSPERLESVRKDLREHLPVQAGLEYRFGDEEGNDTGAKAFEVTISGEETEYLEEIAVEVKRRLQAIDGVTDVFSDFDQGHPEIQIAIDRDKAGRHGVRADNIAQVLGLTYRGTWLPRLNTGKKEIDLSVSLLPDDAESIENLATTLIAVENGRPVLLGQVADFAFERSPQTIHRQDRRTGVTLRGSWNGDRLDDGLDKVRAVMNDVEMPFGYAWNFGSRIRRAQEQNNEMGINLILALMCVFFVMASLFESLVHPGIVMGCVPFASLGVVWLMMATGTPFNIMAFIGMVILIGIVVNNGIVLVDHVNHQRQLGKPMEEAILTGCGDRMRPILMTAGTTILGLLPLAMSGAHMADAQYYPMARALIGGLLSSTVLTLIVLPTYYRIVNEWVAAIRSLVERRRSQAPKSIGRPTPGESAAR